ncbi:MAG: sugar phosphate isomerase/epimerase [Planctomycetes bacterium]|nr:sugar phosphate isomerase/epimerase [Planctomycetota bacterium]
MKIAFNTANLVARCSGYRFELKHWGDQHKKTVATTDEKEWTAICREAAAAGYKALEVWQAHADPAGMNEGRVAAWKKIAADNGLALIGYAGGFTPETVKICQGLGIPAVNGGTPLKPAEATELAQKSGVRLNVENHPEKTAEEILKRIDGGNEWLGVAIDTGWLGTQGANAPQIVETCGKLVRHVHFKDVKAAGGHATCLLGAGVVDLPGVAKTLAKLGYAGWYAWEDEPEDRNPMLSAVQNREYIERLIGR